MKKNNIDRMQSILIVVLICALVLVGIFGVIKSKATSTSISKQIEETKDLEKDSQESSKETENKTEEEADGTKTETEATTVTGTVSINQLNVRNEASLDSSTLLTLKKDEKVTALSKDKEWIKIQFNDITGYVYSEYITLDGTLPSQN